MPEKVYVELSDGRKGWYIVAEEHPDGSLVVRPATHEEVYQAESETLRVYTDVTGVKPNTRLGWLLRKEPSTETGERGQDSTLLTGTGSAS